MCSYKRCKVLWEQKRVCQPSFEGNGPSPAERSVVHRAGGRCVELGFVAIWGACVAARATSYGVRPQNHSSLRAFSLRASRAAHSTIDRPSPGRHMIAISTDAIVRTKAKGKRKKESMAEATARIDATRRHDCCTISSCCVCACSARFFSVWKLDARLIVWTVSSRATAASSKAEWTRCIVLVRSVSVIAASPRSGTRNAVPNGRYPGSSYSMSPLGGEGGRTRPRRISLKSSRPGGEGFSGWRRWRREQAICPTREASRRPLPRGRPAP